MHQSPISKKALFLFSFFSLLLILLLFLFSQFDNSTKIVFCDVGQGDGAYIRLNNKIDILIDSGPDRSILSCLGKHMPFYDRKIELAILSHPQKDHMGGYLYLLDRYSIDNFLMPKLANPNNTFKKLKAKLSGKKVKVDYPYTGTKIKLDQAEIDFYWPEREFVEKNSVSDPKTDNVLPVSALDPNNFSLILKVNLDRYSALFTGDAGQNILDRLSVEKTDILKVPHHGSKHGLSLIFLKLADPTYGVISVGKNNSYGHPSKEVSDMLKAENVIIRRTDMERDIVFQLTR